MDAVPLRLEHFVFDNRFPSAVAVAHHAARAGAHLAGISGDLTALWYDTLDLAWRKDPTALAGVTTRQGLFVLETLAADHRMRVVYRGLHAAPEGGVIAHGLTGPAELIARVRATSDTAEWAPFVARAIMQCPVGASKAATLAMATLADPEPARTEPLVSWIIAPRSAVALTA